MNVAYRSLFILFISLAHNGFLHAGSDPSLSGSASTLRFPLHFIANAGQWNADIQFGIIRGTDKAAFTREGVRFYSPAERPDVLPLLETGAQAAATTKRTLACKMLEFVNPSPNLRMEGIGRIETHTNFYRGNDMANWRTDVPTFSGVRYVNAWDGIDVEYIEKDGKLRQRIILHEGADARQVVFASGGLTELEISTVDESSPRLVKKDGKLVLPPPSRVIPYRNFFDVRKAIETEFNTFFGGSGIDAGMGMGGDKEGNIHIAGVTTSSDFPVHRAMQPSHAGGTLEHDYFVTRLSDDARTIIFSTYLGGSGDEWSGPMKSEFLGTYVVSPKNMVAVGDLACTHVLCNTGSVDFPNTPGSLQATRYDGSPVWRSSTAVVRLGQTGALEAATWLGGPTFFGGMDITTDPSGNVIVLGLAPGEQWFVTPGSLQDTPKRSPVAHDTVLHTAVLVKLSRDYSSVLVGTYIIDQIIYNHLHLFHMATDSDGNVILSLNNFYPTLDPIPRVNSWMPHDPKHGHILLKVDAAFSRYIFTTGLGGDASINNIMIDGDDNILIAGTTYFTGGVRLWKPLSEGPSPLYLAKFPPSGVEPVFVTRFPWDAGGPTTTSYEPHALYPLPCGDICLMAGTGIERRVPYTINPLDTVGGIFSLFTIDPSGQNFVSLGYWHLDEKYIRQAGTHQGGGFLNGDQIIARGGYFVRNNILTVLSSVLLRSADSVSMLRALQDRYAGGENDLFLYRTRLPGCEMLSCSVVMEDSVRVTCTPPRLDPERLTVSAEVRNIHPTLAAGDVECVLVLPPGLMLDPPAQPLRKTPPAGALAAGASASFAWTVKVDTATLQGKGLWVDVVTYYHHASDAPEGPPSSTRCDHYLEVEYIPYGDLELACTVEAPSRLDVNAASDGYDPTPFPVRLSVRNISSEAVDIARFVIDFGGDIGGGVSPAGDRVRPGLTLAPGASHEVAWLPWAERRADGRTTRVMVTSEAAAGSVLGFCETDVTVPGLAPLQCAVPEPLRIFIPEDTTGWQAGPFTVGVTLRQVLDTLLLDAFAEVDLSGCQYLRLAAGESPLRGPLRLRADERDTLRWALSLREIPPGGASDTIRYRLSAGGGRWQRECIDIVPITPFIEGASCGIAARDSLSAAEIASFTPVYLDFTLENTGTVPFEVSRYELSMGTGGGLRSVVPLRQNGETLAGGARVVKFWELRGEKVPTDRMMRCVVTAYGPAENVIAACEHVIRIEATDGAVTCALTLPDRIAFDRDSLRYAPNPFSAALRLDNPFDSDETNVEVEMDLTAAPELHLATGESATHPLALLGKTAALQWQLEAIATPAEAAQDVLVRFRSNQHPDWSTCRATVLLEPWPEIAEVRCATAGHDSMFADAAYEAIVPDPIQFSYTATNSGTVSLTGCQAAIVLPAGFALAGSDSIQSFGANAPGMIAPGESTTRWWTVTTTDQLQGFGARDVTWVWSSDQQGSTGGCTHTVRVLPDPSSGIVLTPRRLYFEAESGSALPAAQSVKLWTGGGLPMPWTMQSDAWYIDIDPIAGDRTASIAVQPNTTLLNKGLHSSTITVGGAAGNPPRNITVDYMISSLTEVEGHPTARALSLGPVYPHPIPLAGEARILIRGPRGQSLRVTLHDLLGRERALLREGMTTEREILYLRPAALGLAPGVYLLRVHSTEGLQTRIVTVVR
ncbi:MAG: T9SS type A sorting domain-containing protein [Bacteroidetes bacterium]|nr:T9SS type A sorting domain-containing protein [Bacteroidota bacterium]